MDFLIHHLLQSSAQRFPEKKALVHADQRLSYAQLASRTQSLARQLRALGLLRGDRIGIYLEAGVPQVISIFAISQAGGVFVPINKLLFAEQVAYIVENCQMKGLITTASRLPDLQPRLQELPSLEFLILVSDQALPPVSLPCYNFDELSQPTPAESWQDHNIDRDLAALLYTSGSTGKPKGVMLTHSQVIAGSSIVSDYLQINSAERILAILPFSFDAGLNQLITAIHQGATLVLINFIFAREIVQQLLKEQITGLAGVPTLWSLLVQTSSGLHKASLPHLRYITNTGGKLPQSTLALLRERLPSTQIFLMYGLTEAFRSTYLPPEELDRRPTSIGKAIPNTEIMIINSQGKLCEPGEIGELVHRGPTVSSGYWGHPELTDQVLRPHPFLPPDLAVQEKVCYSGDLVKMDAEGFFYFVGRRDTMIKSSGFRISPTEVEEVLMNSGKLQAAAVIGVPDEILGQSIKAFVVPTEGLTLDQEALLTFCSEHLPAYMMPKNIVSIARLPQTTSGKVDYPALHLLKER